MVVEGGAEWGVQGWENNDCPCSQTQHLAEPLWPPSQAAPAPGLPPLSALWKWKNHGDLPVTDVLLSLTPDVGPTLPTGNCTDSTTCFSRRDPNSYLVLGYAMCGDRGANAW